jgi:beta-glucosidase
LATEPFARRAVEEECGAMSSSFPRGFVWGAAAASYQIEGAAFADDKGLSTWDMFCRKPGAVWNAQHGDVACDHFHRYREDVALMKAIGLGAYRLSVSWPRVLPDGVGRVSASGLAFYDRLVDELLAAGITPWVTLFHWDYPLALYHRGGWLNRDSVEWFGEFADVVARKLSDRVQNWMTLNEPQVFIGAGHHEGRHAPGDRLRFAEVLLAGHHALMAHGRSVQAIRAASSRPMRIGFAPVGMSKIPVSDRPEDVEAARGAAFSVTAETAWTNSWWMDPVFLGGYPEQGLAFFGEQVPHIAAGDLELISQPVDFCGVNIYQGQHVRAGESGPEAVPPPVGFPITAFEWLVTPGALQEADRDHRKWHLLSRLGLARRRRARRRAHRFHGASPGRAAPSALGRRAHRGIFSLVVDRQLRVGSRLQAALWLGFLRLS